MSEIILVPNNYYWVRVKGIDSEFPKYGFYRGDQLEKPWLVPTERSVEEYKTEELVLKKEDEL